MSDTPEQPGQAPADQPTASPAPAVNAAELAEARKEAAKYRTELRKLQEAQEAAQREAAEQQGQYQKLYETEKQRAAELEPVRARAEALEATVAGMVKELARDLPEEVRALMPEAAPEVQLEWLGKARKAAAKLTEARTPGTPTGPRGNGTVAASTPDLIAQKRASGNYSL